MLRALPAATKQRRSAGASGQAGRTGPRPWLLFVLLFLLYNSNLRPIATGDSVSAALIPVSLAVDHTITLDRFAPWLQVNAPSLTYGMQSRHGAMYSTYPIGGPLLIAPAYLPLAAIPAVRRLSTEELFLLARLLEKLAAAALAAGSVLVMLALLEGVTTPGWAWGLTLVYALATGTWATSSQALWQETFGALPLALALLFLRRGQEHPRALWWCGIAAGAAIAVRPTNGILLPALVAALWAVRARPRAYARVVIPMATAALLVAAYNVAIFGRPTGGYPSQLGGQWLTGLAGVLVSPGRGLLVYTPVVAFALLAALPAAAPQRRQHRALLVASTAFVALQIALIAKWHMWWGGYCWGPRLLVELLPFAVVLIALGAGALERSRLLRASFLVLVGYSCAIQIIGAYCYPMGAWDARPVSVDVAPGRLWDWQDNPIRRTLAGGIMRAPYRLAARILLGD